MNKQILWAIPLIALGILAIWQYQNEKEPPAIRKPTSARAQPDASESKNDKTTIAHAPVQEPVQPEAKPSHQKFIVDEAPAVASAKRIGIQLSIKPENVEQASGELAYRKEFIDSIKGLKPLYLGDLQWEEGEPLDNRIEVLQREPSTTNGSLSSIQYSLPEMFHLCSLVGAKPWIAVPSTLSEEDCLRFGEWLSMNAPKQKFPEIILQMDDQGGGLFGKILSTNNAANLYRVNSGRFLADSSSGSDESSIARLLSLMAKDGKPLVYAPATPQELMAVRLLNNVIQGSLHTANAEEPGQSELIQAIAFRTSRKWSAVLISRSSEPVSIELEFPHDTRELPSIMGSLRMQSDSTPEQKEIHFNGRKAQITIPPHSLITLEAPSSKS